MYFSTLLILKNAGKALTYDPSKILHLWLEEEAFAPKHPPGETNRGFPQRSRSTETNVVIATDQHRDAK